MPFCKNKEVGKRNLKHCFKQLYQHKTYVKDRFSFALSICYHSQNMLIRSTLCIEACRPQATGLPTARLPSMQQQHTAYRAWCNPLSTLLCNKGTLMIGNSLILIQERLYYSQGLEFWVRKRLLSVAARDRLQPILLVGLQKKAWKWGQSAQR